MPRTFLGAIGLAATSFPLVAWLQTFSLPKVGALYVGALRPLYDSPEKFYYMLGLYVDFWSWQGSQFEFYQSRNPHFLRKLRSGVVLYAVKRVKRFEIRLKFALCLCTNGNLALKVSGLQFIRPRYS